MKRLAIIGASIGQLPLCKKAKEMGHETFVFAWDKGAVCKGIADHFYPISIYEYDKIVEICKQNNIEGVVSNASDQTAEAVAYIAEKLKLNGTPYDVLMSLHDKYKVRSITQNISGLDTLRYYKYQGEDKSIYPCVVKPCVGGSKKGVSFVNDRTELTKALDYASLDNNQDILIEEFVEGKEISVESISFHGRHSVIQITDKDSSSAPHFVELGHHQPAQLPPEIRQKILDCIPRLLSVIGYTNGASHFELKYNNQKLFLIEANLRGGGDEISNRLVSMSTNVDYLKCLIDVALNNYSMLLPEQTNHAGIYYLCKQTANLLPLFKNAAGQPWCVEEQISSDELKESHSNYEHDGYLIYKSDHKITFKDTLL